MHLRALILFVIGILLCGCQHGKIQTQDGRVLETHGANAEGLDDPLEAKVTVKVGRIGFLMGGSAGAFYRGYIEKATLTPTYQLYIQTNSGEWKFWDKAKFLSSDGVKEYPVAPVGSDVYCSQYGCAHYEDSVLRLDSEILKSWMDKPTTIRLSSSKVAGNKDIDLNQNDTKDFINAMDQITSYLKEKMNRNPKSSQPTAQ